MQSIVIDNDVARNDLHGVARMSILLLSVMLGTLLFEIVFNYATGVVGQKSMHDLRVSIFRHVSRLDVQYFDRTPVGRLMTRMTSDVSALNDLFSTGVIALFAETLMLAGLIGERSRRVSRASTSAPRLPSRN